MEIGTDTQTAVMAAARGKKTQDVMENGEEIEEITLKSDGLTDANTTTGRGERTGNEIATVTVKVEENATRIVKRAATVVTARAAESMHRSRSPSHSKSPVDKAKPNFNPSGLLAAATNTVSAADGTNTVLKYNEPPEARKPMLGWRLYVFKGSEQTGDLYLRTGAAVFNFIRQNSFTSIGRALT
ncbi:hypothetical protein JVT61DRAFT_1145 [Boletus reticuloceps]|uniref:Uncharacterized protein n=1 Tax=Boletus reticuloceps TaxID=495285 RepID=A0A8I2YPY2_9AGAM|nr:hypothetical protein JVT61DRAFT_1145 [Boletus reticuloceps]